MIALPNELADDRERLGLVCDDLSKALIGENREMEYAVHFNKSKTNLHMHLLFSERERVNEIEPKRYKRDMWYDIETNKMAKAKAVGAELRHHKGDIMRDKEGNIRYEQDFLTVKDVRFKTQAFLWEHRHIIKDVLNEHGFDVNVQDRDTPYLSQKKLYKGSTKEYKDTVKAYNDEVKQYNAAVDVYLEYDPSQKPIYKDIRKTLEDDIKQENRLNQGFTSKATEIVKGIRLFVKDIIKDFEKTIKGYVAESKLGAWWNDVKNDVEQELEQSCNLEQVNDDIRNYVGELEDDIEREKGIIDEFEEMTRSKGYDISL